MTSSFIQDNAQATKLFATAKYKLPKKKDMTDSRRYIELDGVNPRAYH
jgi:hypothetical protein